MADKSQRTEQPTAKHRKEIREKGKVARSPELGGGSLIDEGADLIWRKVARREPGKLSRYAQAVVSGLHTSMRVPGLDRVFPAVTVDREDRPYHPGWLLYAWAELTGAPPLLTHEVVGVFREHWAYDSNKARRELGYRLTPLREGLRRTLAWLRPAA